MDPARIAAAILDLAVARGADKTICPSEKLPAILADRTRLHGGL